VDSLTNLLADPSTITSILTDPSIVVGDPIATAAASILGSTFVGIVGNQLATHAIMSFLANETNLTILTETMGRFLD
jgi:hypothetical protein